MVGNFHGECPIQETGRQVTVHFALVVEKYIAQGEKSRVGGYFYRWLL